MEGNWSQKRWSLSFSNFFTQAPCRDVGVVVVVRNLFLKMKLSIAVKVAKKKKKKVPAKAFRHLIRIAPADFPKKVKLDTTNPEK